MTEPLDTDNHSPTVLSEDEIKFSIGEQLERLRTLSPDCLERVSPVTVEGQLNPFYYMIAAVMENETAENAFVSAGQISSFEVTGIEKLDKNNTYAISVVCKTPYLAAYLQHENNTESSYYAQEYTGFVSSGAASTVAQLKMDGIPVVTDKVDLFVVVQEDIPIIFYTASTNYGYNIPQYAFLWGSYQFDGIINGDLQYPNTLGAFTPADKEIITNALPDSINRLDFTEQLIHHVRQGDWDGASEGIYLDITIHYTDEQGKWTKNHFATGKTLGESSLDLDRMFLIASACRKAFHTDGLHARYIMLGEAPQPEGLILHLSEDEREFLIDSLIDVRSRTQAENKPVDPAEQLLRRIIGSITGYMEAVGERPQNISPYDYAILSIRDSNMKGFLKAYQEIPHEEFGDLLVHAAGRPGRIGKEMTELLLAGAKNIPCETYKAACERAVDTCDLERAVLLLEKADGCVKDLNISMYGSVIEHALYSDERRGYTENIALALIKKCTPEQISAVNPYLLENSILFNKVYVAYEMIKKGMPYDPDKVMFDIAKSRNTQTFYMLRREMGEDLRYSGALRLCMRWNNLDAAIFLLRNGVDFGEFRDSIEVDSLNQDQKSFLSSLTHYWEENIKKK